MSPDGWITLVIVVAAFSTVLFSSVAADAVFITAAVLLMFFGVLTPGEMLSGFSNSGLATIAVLFVVASALTRTGALFEFSQQILGRSANPRIAQLRLMAPVAVVSSVLNNTPVVAMMIPIVSDWAKRFGLPLGKLMIPLSYAAIIGGTCTLVGTSTNLVVNDMMLERSGEGFALFELAWVGVPAVLATLVFFVLIGHRLLPSSGAQASVFEDTKQYTIEMLVTADSPLHGRSVDQAGLRQLGGVFLVEIIRGEKVFPAVSSSEILERGDRLIFAGDVSSVVDLQKMRGLTMAENQVYKIDGDRSQRSFVEAVLGSSFPYIGKTVRDSQFRKRYGAAILAVSREGEQIKQRVGDIEFKRGDILLLETPPEFLETGRVGKDFLFVSALENSKPTLHDRRYWALAILLLQLALVASGILSLFQAVCVAALALVFTRCISLNEARQSVDWQVLVVIASAMAVGLAVEKTGIARLAAEELLAFSGQSALISLALTFVITALMTAVVSNIAAAVILFPIIQGTAAQLGVNVEPFAVVLMVAASASFATPIGYQTNLMVYGPGNYRYRDFLKVGLPLTLLIGLVTVFIAPIVWPFY